MNTNTLGHEFCYKGVTLVTVVSNAVILPLLPVGEGCFALSKKHLHAKTASELSIGYDLPVLSSYVCDHAASLRISVNADLSTMFKC